MACAVGAAPGRARGLSLTRRENGIEFKLDTQAGTHPPVSGYCSFTKCHCCGKLDKGDKVSVFLLFIFIEVYRYSSHWASQVARW